MKRVLAIGDTAEPSSTPARTLAPPLVKTVTPSKDVRKPAGPAVWIRQSDGSWAIRWRGDDTWWDLAARYLQSGKRWRELFAYQSDAFHARVPEPIAIYTTAVVAMPPEAVQRAQLLGEAPGAAGASSAGASSAGGANAPVPPKGTSPGGPGSSATGAASSSGSSSDPSKPAGGGGASSSPIVVGSPSSGRGGESALLWILGVLGAAGLAGMGVLAYRAQRTEEEARA